MDIICKFDGEFFFLSNFFESKVEYEGITYPTVEHAFQAAKTLDNDTRKKVAAAGSPGQAKRMGRSLYLRADWEKVKFKVMEDLIREKFKNPGLKEKLLSTGDAELVEGNTWHDNIWGNCNCPRCIEIEGQNNLGKTLMKIRKEIRDNVA